MRKRFPHRSTPMDQFPGLKKMALDQIQKMGIGALTRFPPMDLCLTSGSIVHLHLRSGSPRRHNNNSFLLHARGLAVASFSRHSRARTDEFGSSGERRASVLNLDLIEQLNKQSQWQYGKITRSLKIMNRFQSYFSQQIPVFSIERAEQAQKQKFPFRDYIPTKENTHISRGFTTRNHSISTTKRTAQGLIQRYKVRYSQKGVT